MMKIHELICINPSVNSIPNVLTHKVLVEIKKIEMKSKGVKKVIFSTHLSCPRSLRPINSTHTIINKKSACMGKVCKF